MIHDDTTELTAVDVQIDSMFSNISPSPVLHTVIEPHPSVLAHMEETGWTTEQKPNLMVLKGKWQEFMESEEIYKEGGYDLIYFDTFSEGYGGALLSFVCPPPKKRRNADDCRLSLYARPFTELKAFFQHLPNLLAGPESRFSFFHGLGATSPTFHDTYTTLSALHLREVGLETCEWYDVPVGDEVREEVWNGVRRKCVPPLFHSLRMTRLIRRASFCHTGTGLCRSTACRSPRWNDRSTESQGRGARDCCK